jgi:acetyl esterase/lipase
MIKNLRSSFIFGTIIPKPSQCQINKEIFQHGGHSIDTYWIDYPTRKFLKHSDKLILYLHGGGYMFGDIHSELFDIFRKKISHVLYFDRL